MTPLDLLLVFRDARPSAGGLSVNLRDLANGLSERGHNVDVLTVATRDGGHDSGPYEFSDGVDLVELPPLLRKQFALRYGLALGAGRLVRRRRQAIVHVFSCVPAYLHLAAMETACRAGRPLVWTPMMHPARSAVWADYGMRGRAMRVFDAVIPRMARFTDAVVAATRAEADQFRRLGSKRVELLPPAVQEAPLVRDSEAASLRQRFEIGDRPLVLTVARRLERRKGMPFCIESFRRLHRDMPDARLLIAGLGDLGALDVPEGVILAGRLSGSDLARAYRAADVIFVSSSYEAFSMIVIEAWQQERPVVVTDRVGLAESVRDTGGTVVPFGDAKAASDALNSYLNDKALSEHTGKEGRTTVQEQFLMPDLLDRMQLLYQEICHG